MPRRLQVRDGLDGALAADFAAIRTEIGISEVFPPEVEEAARAAVERGPVAAERSDRTAIEFVTIDPPGSRDLDQALHIAERDDGLRVSYAIADVGAFVDRGGPIEAEAWRRGVTAYSPDLRAPLYPPAISEGSASLLPGARRPAFLFTADLDRRGEIRAFGIERAVVESRQRLSYADAERRGMPLLQRLGRLREGRARARGAIRLDLPAQEIVPDRRAGCGYRLRFERRLEIEDWNAHVSLLTGIGAAQAMLERGEGLLRVLDPPAPADLARARAAAAALAEPTGPAALSVLRRVMGRARYAYFAGGSPGGHAGLGAPYAHVTAPLRRLADRYVLEWLADGLRPGWSETLARLPDVMRAADARAGRLERALIDAAEARTLAFRVGDRFDALVLHCDDRGAQILILRPPVVARLDQPAAVGSRLRVTLAEVDPARRRVVFRKSR